MFPVANPVPPPAQGAHAAARGWTNLNWLVRLRWALAAGQGAAVLLAVQGVSLPLPWEVLLAFIGVGMLSNAGLHAWILRRSAGPRDERREALPDAALDAIFGVVLLLDVLLLTMMLAASGGPANPFSIFYLVHVVLAAVLLPPRWAWLSVVTAGAGYALLFAVHMPIPGLSMHHGAPAAPPTIVGSPAGEAAGGLPGQPQAQRPLSAGISPTGATHTTHAHGPLPGADDDDSLHLKGMLVAFAMAAWFIVYFIVRITGDLRSLEARFEHERSRRVRAEHLQGLATVAAGAAHELASPLGTVAVATSELLHAAQNRSDLPEDWTADLELVRAEVGRCRDILDDMAAGAGQIAVTAGTRVSAATLADETLAGEPQRHRIRVSALGDGVQSVPLRAVTRAIRSLLHNALQSGPADVEFSVMLTSDGTLRVDVRDSGVGIDPDLLPRLGQPFLSTREPGRGMGLGIYLARSVFEQLDGELTIVSNVGQGTHVIATARLQPDAPLSPQVP